ncbi:unnamed protein product [Amoebophrya sp. A120]|nr:unnamed protein product [Amoebophrya sp. A120]|eukprot:GSA120T00020629001.1
MTVLNLSAACLQEAFNEKCVLITGATGSFGQHLVSKILEHCTPAAIVILSRDELKQSVMQEKFGRRATVKYLLGDIRDYERLTDAFEDVDIVIHGAALKQVPSLERNPFEAIKTNVLGANNVIRAAVACGVKKLIALSTDNASSPVSLYGATKLCQDKLMVAANHMYRGKARQAPVVSVVRLGNVFGSSGSVVPLFLQQAQLSGTVTVTDENMTRFTMALDESVGFVVNCINMMRGGEIFVPKLSTYRLGTLVDVFASENIAVSTVGARPGERIHEVMVPQDEAVNALEFDDHFVICPDGPWWDAERKFYKESKQGKHVGRNFVYSSNGDESGPSSTFVSKEDLQGLLADVLDRAEN